MNSPFLLRSRSYAVPLIITLNVLVFLMWAIGGSDTREMLANNFLVSWTALYEGRVWTLITSVFSHNAFWHIFLNMFVLNSFGGLLERLLGTKSFLLFYLIAGVVSSFSHSAVSAWILQQPDLPALGASGSISGLVLVYSLLFPKERILIFGLIPVPALWGALAFVGLDLWGLIMQAEGRGLPIGHGAHLGGALTGAIYYWYFLRKRSPPSFA